MADTRALREKTRELRALLRSYVITTFGAEALQVLGDFGMRVPKPRGPQTAAEKAKAASKAAATRKARREALKHATLSGVTTPPK